MTFKASHTDVLVIGGGPAGMSAALHAAQRGAHVVIVDENPSMGGQIWRGGSSQDFKRLFEQISRHSITIMRSTGVERIDCNGRFRAGLITDHGVTQVESDRIIMACGARELFLPFDGWTTPGVFGLGGLQALIKGGFDVYGKRVALVGSGPLMLAVAAVVRDAGAVPVVMVEQAKLSGVVRALGVLTRNPTQWTRFAEYASALHGVPRRFGWLPSRVTRSQSLELEITDGKRRESIETDLIACGFGLIPNLQLARTLGCEIRGGVIVDRYQRTSVDGVYCAGESCGIGGVDAALAEGAIAAIHATDGVPPESLLDQRDDARSFVSKLNACFALDARVRSMASDDAILCRCEDVRIGSLRSSGSWRELKLRHRCGMGVCQSRVCGPAVEVLTGWAVQDYRPPTTAVTVSELIELLREPQS